MIFVSYQFCNIPLKGHIALDWASWSIKNVCCKCICLKDVLKVEYNDLHKYVLKLHGFPFRLN